MSIEYRFENCVAYLEFNSQNRSELWQCKQSISSDDIKKISYTTQFKRIQSTQFLKFSPNKYWQCKWLFFNTNNATTNFLFAACAPHDWISIATHISEHKLQLKFICSLSSIAVLWRKKMKMHIFHAIPFCMCCCRSNIKHHSHRTYFSQGQFWWVFFFLDFNIKLSFTFQLEFDNLYAE